MENNSPKRLLEDVPTEKLLLKLRRGNSTLARFELLQRAIINDKNE